MPEPSTYRWMVTCILYRLHVLTVPFRCVLIIAFKWQLQKFDVRYIGLSTRLLKLQPNSNETPADTDQRDSCSTDRPFLSREVTLFIYAYLHYRDVKMFWWINCLRISFVCLTSDVNKSRRVRWWCQLTIGSVRRNQVTWPQCLRLI